MPLDMSAALLNDLHNDNVGTTMSVDPGGRWTGIAIVGPYGKVYALGVWENIQSVDIPALCQLMIIWNVVEIVCERYIGGSNYNQDVPHVIDIILEAARRRDLHAHMQAANYRKGRELDARRAVSKLPGFMLPPGDILGHALSALAHAYAFIVSHKRKLDV